MPGAEKQGSTPQYPSSPGPQPKDISSRERLRERRIPGVAQLSKDEWTEQTLLCSESSGPLPSLPRKGN